MAVDLSASGLSRPKAPSVARLRAQRANAQLSTGPRTREGRRRSALNRLGLKRPEKLWWDHLGSAPRPDYLRIWRDLVSLFQFVNPRLWREVPQLEIYLRDAAEAWAYKLRSARNGFVSEGLNAGIHSRLSRFRFEFRVHNQKCDYWLRKEFGSDGRINMNKLREGIEARMSSFREWPRLVKRAKNGATNKGPHGCRTHSDIFQGTLDLTLEFPSRALEYFRNKAKPASDTS